MVNKGFIREVEMLIEKGLTKNLSASQAIGYRQCIEFLKSSKSNDDWERFVWEFKKASRRYAKRQFTWARGHMKSWEKIYSSNINDLFEKAINKIS